MRIAAVPSGRVPRTMRAVSLQPPPGVSAIDVAQLNPDSARDWNAANTGTLACLRACA